MATVQERKERFLKNHPDYYKNWYLKNRAKIKAYQKKSYRNGRQKESDAKDNAIANLNNFITHTIDITKRPAAIVHNLASKRGRLGELIFLAKAYSMNWEVAIPADNMLPYDIIIRKDPKFAWETVQIKTPATETEKIGNHSRTRMRIKLVRASSKEGKVRHYAKNDFDLLAVVSPDKIWLVPNTITKSLSNFQIDQPKYDKFILE